MSSHRFRSTAISSSIWTLIQGIVYLTLSSFGLSIFECNLDMTKGGKLQYILYFIYMYNDDCGTDINLGVLDPSLNGLNATFDSTPFTAVRSYDWFLIYIVISSAWIITSSIMFLGAIFKLAGRGIYITITPWILTTVLTLFADAIAAITYAIDIPQTLTWQSTLNFIGVNIPGIIETGDFSGTWIPSAVMVIFFGRLIVFWFINIFILIAVVIEGNGNNNKVDHATQQAVIDQFGNNAWSGSEVGVSRNNNMNPKLIESMKRAFAKEISQRENPYATPTPIPAPTPINNYDARSQDNSPIVDYNPGVSTLKKEYERRQSTQQRGYGPEELRSQLPWSYFQDRNEPKRAPRRTTSRDMPEDAPPVPVPDYTLHFPKRPRDNEIGMGKPVKQAKSKNDFSDNSYNKQSQNPYG